MACVHRCISFALLTFECSSLKIYVLDRSLAVTDSRLIVLIRFGCVGCGFMTQCAHLAVFFHLTHMYFSCYRRAAIVAGANRREQTLSRKSLLKPVQPMVTNYAL
jgi:hypothetical protein